VLLSSTREWPWGLVVFGDPNDHSQLPTALGEEVAVSTVGTIACRILHAVDGRATATALLDSVQEPNGLLLAYETRLELPSGRLRLGDAGNEVTEEAQVAPGRYAVRVFVDEPKHPSDVRFELSSNGR
jgi:hypothetical protein